MSNPAPRTPQFQEPASAAPGASAGANNAPHNGGGGQRRRRRRRSHSNDTATGNNSSTTPGGATPAGTKPTGTSPASTNQGEAAPRGRRRRGGRNRKRPQHLQVPSIEQAPIVAISLATSGIHPTTARIVAISAAFYAGSAAEEFTLGEPVATFTRRINPTENPGPWHLHGYSQVELSAAQPFTHLLDAVRRIIDGRTIIVHQAGMTWGFITHEFRRANKPNGRNRRGRQRNDRPVATPIPAAIIDTLGTARRQSQGNEDPRLRAVAARYPIAETTSATTPDLLLHLGAAASMERAETPADQLLEADAHLIAHLAQAQWNHDATHWASLSASDLTADQFGIQRNTHRIEATNAMRYHVNPGTWQPGKPLVKGMEFVISPDIAADPDLIIDRGLAAGLVYSEKLNRKSSMVICNENFPLRGKAMHAERKQIPLISDTTFLELLDNVEEGERAARPIRPGAGVRPRTSSMTASTASTASTKGATKGTKNANKNSSKTPNNNANNNANNSANNSNTNSVAENPTPRTNPNNQDGKPAARRRRTRRGAGRYRNQQSTTQKSNS